MECPLSETGVLYAEPREEEQMKLVLSGIPGRFIATAIVVVLFLGGAGSLADGQSMAPSQKLQQVVNRYIEAWNTHDPSILGKFFTADVDMIMGTGPILIGGPAVENWWHKYFAVQEPERTLTIEVKATRTIAPGVVLLNVRTITGGRTAAGAELPARKARGTWVLVRRGGKWLISAMRGMPTEQDRIIRKIYQPKY